MTAVSRIKHLFWLSVMFLSAMSATILVIPAAVHEQGNAGVLPKIIAILFWLFAVSGYSTVFLANKRRKKFLYRRFGRDIQENFRPGIFCFFSNPLAKITDISAIFVLLLFGGIMCTSLKNTYLAVVLLSLLIWAANMHCLFNSRTFRITKYKYKKREEVSHDTSKTEFV